MKFYTLLYIDESEKRQLRGKTRGGDERIKIFLRNAAMLNKSLMEFGGVKNPLTIVSNNVSLIKRLSEEIGYQSYRILDIPFDLNVPKGIPFYSAHYKIDVFRYLATLKSDEYSILIDNDVILLNKFPDALQDIVTKGIPICYKLSGYDVDRIMNDTRLILADIPMVEWCGGEFIGGTSCFWKDLYNKCVSIAPAYFNSIDKGLFHVGDEMLTSMAIALLSENGYRILDAGTVNMVKRYWGVNEKNTLDALKTAFVHLPADKVWIASRDLNCQFTPPRFYQFV